MLSVNYNHKALLARVYGIYAMTDYPIKSPGKLIAVSLPLDAINKRVRETNPSGMANI